MDRYRAQQGRLEPNLLPNAVSMLSSWLKIVYLELCRAPLQAFVPKGKKKETMEDQAGSGVGTRSHSYLEVHSVSPSQVMSNCCHGVKQKGLDLI